MKIFKIFLNLLILLILTVSCAYEKVDQRQRPDGAKAKARKNIEEGRGMRLFQKKEGGVFDFASSNPLWRASLDTINFMPLLSANYSGCIIITDWYSDNSADNESIKITIRFLTSEVRSDAIEVTIFKKDCNAENKCSIYQEDGDLTFQVKKSILKKAALYKEEKIKKNRKPYDPGGDGVGGGTTIF